MGLVRVLAPTSEGRELPAALQPFSGEPTAGRSIPPVDPSGLAVVLRWLSSASARGQVPATGPARATERRPPGGGGHGQDWGAVRAGCATVARQSGACGSGPERLPGGPKPHRDAGWRSGQRRRLNVVHRRTEGLRLALGHVGDRRAPQHGPHRLDGLAPHVGVLGRLRAQWPLEQLDHL